MDRINISGKVKELFGKYKYVALILLLGIVLMLLPEGSEAPSPQTAEILQPAPATQAQQLEEILSQISGVGRVRVLLTEAAGAETIYQTDQDSVSSSDSQTLKVETVIITDSDRTQTGLVRTVTPPTYLGAIIVCQGGNDPTVRLAIAQAVSNVTGIGFDRITVLKMK